MSTETIKLKKKKLSHNLRHISCYVFGNWIEFIRDIHLPLASDLSGTTYSSEHHNESFNKNWFLYAKALILVKWKSSYLKEDE